MKGQLEVSFQWIYVVLAGGAFLLMFFFVFKGCTDANEQQISTGSVRSAATAISSAVWQEAQRNITLDADVACVGEVLTLRTDSASTQLEQAPAFLSPALKGEVFLLTREVNIRQQGTPSIRLGNVVYGIDANTHYYVIKDQSRRYEDVLELSVRNIRLAEQVQNIKVPSTANALVIISWSQPQIPQAPNIPVYAVWVKSPTQVEFLKVEDGRLVSKGVSNYENQEMLLGAVIAAQYSTYECGKRNFFGRAQQVIDIYNMRVDDLRGEVDESCRPTLQQASSILSGSVSSIMTSSIMSQQATLNGLGCPVVA